MDKEKIINQIVDRAMVKVRKGELPQEYQEYVLLQNNLNNDIRQNNNTRKIIDIHSKWIENEGKSDLVKKFINKKERGSKVAINNDNIGLFLEQERSGKGEWGVSIKDLSVDNNPRVERKKFGNNYKEAEKYYGKLFFDYKFNEIKKDDEIIKKDKSELISSFMIEKRNERISDEHQFQGAMVGMVGGAGVSCSLGTLCGISMPIQFFIPFMIFVMMIGTAGGGILGYLTFDNLIRAFP